MTVFAEITILVVLATAVSFIMRILRQPLVIGYIITGLLGGPLFLNLVKSEEILNLFSEIGIAFLLFIVGLNLTPTAIKSFGKVSLITGLGQVIFTFSVGLFIATSLGLPLASALYLSIGLTFSSTIIILKLLSDKGDLEKLYGKISIGFLLIQDFIAILVLFLIPILSSGTSSDLELFLAIAKGLLMLLGAYLLSFSILPKLNRFAARSQELLFLFSIAWGLGLAGLFRAVGFSLESGALIAGATLSILPSHDEIHARLKPLRDFFIILFFVLLGAKMVLAGTGALIVPAIILSLFVLIGNPIIMLVIMSILGYKNKTSFQTGLTVAQISEFSLIIIALGVQQNHIPGEILSLATMVGLITIFVSTYMIMHSDKLYDFLSPILQIFEKRNARDQKLKKHDPELVLFGYNRIGYDFLKAFRSLKKPMLAIDYDPQVIEILDQQKVPTEYGDASDVDFLRFLPLNRAKLVVSTIPDLHANSLIMKEIKRRRKKIITMAVAHTIEEANRLYKLGVDYVIMPHFLGGQHASLLVKDFELDKHKFARLRAQHKRYLESRANMGHEHIWVRPS